MAATQHVVVLGLMGSGKTSTGRLLAERLGWRFDDSDATIERESGSTVRQLASDVGVGRMHQLESEHLEHALAAQTPSVIAAAASTVDNSACRQRLKEPDVFVVWLDVDIDTLAGRFDAKAHRPLLGPTPGEMLSRQLAERGPRYHEVADLRVTEHGRPPADTVNEIVAALAVAGVTSTGRIDSSSRG